MNLNGEKCAKCGEVFKEDDDIVVCPECGSPHHRECYLADNKCANSEKHAEGYKWQHKTTEKVKAEIPESEGQNKLKDQKMHGIPSIEIAAFVRTNMMYYMMHFERFERTAKNISYNFICFLFPPLYFANRRMWSWAIFTAVISTLLAMPVSVATLADAGMLSTEVTQFLTDNRDSVLWLVQMCNVLDFVFRLFFCLFGNRLYFGFVIKSLRRMREEKGGDLKPQDLINVGGVKLLNGFLIILISSAMMLWGMLLSQHFLEQMCI